MSTYERPNSLTKKYKAGDITYTIGDVVMLVSNAPSPHNTGKIFTVERFSPSDQYPIIIRLFNQKSNGPLTLLTVGFREIKKVEAPKEELECGFAEHISFIE